ncbi:MAG: prepilin peptidase [Pseudomonadota bacterium]
MNLAQSPELWFLLAATPIAIWAAYSDLSRMKIPNKAVAALMLTFLVLGALALPWSEFAWRWVHFVVVLLIGFIASSLGLLGAGDAKFAAAMAPFIALSHVSYAMFIFAGCIIFGFLTHRLARSIGPLRRATPTWVSWENTRQFPMGYPLALTLIVYLASIAFRTQ